MSARLTIRGAWAQLRLAGIRAGLRIRPDDVSRVEEPAAGRIRATCIVFSKDRPMQLEACLRSILRSAPYDGPIVVVYRATTAEFAEGYRRIDLDGRVRLVAQTDDFRADVMAAIDTSAGCTIFHTDDDVFFRTPPATPVLPPGVGVFSVRLGTNTTYCYPLRRRQAVPSFTGEGPFMAWAWPRADGDFAYPMSLDGQLIRTELLLRMLAGARFANPNQLEEELHLRRYLCPPTMLAFRESCLVSLPINIVTSTHRNRAGDDPALSPEALNTRFLDGERIDLDAMDFSAVQGAHENVPLVFKGPGA